MFSLLQRLEYHTPMSFEQALAMGRTGILPSPVINGYKPKGLGGSGLQGGRHSDSDEEDWCQQRLNNDPRLPFSQIKYAANTLRIHNIAIHPSTEFLFFSNFKRSHIAQATQIIHTHTINIVNDIPIGQQDLYVKTNEYTI